MTSDLLLQNIHTSRYLGGTRRYKITTVIGRLINTGFFKIIKIIAIRDGFVLYNYCILTVE